jgi:hypothetical protein
MQMNETHDVESRQKSLKPLERLSVICGIGSFLMFLVCVGVAVAFGQSVDASVLQKLAGWPPLFCFFCLFIGIRVRSYVRTRATLFALMANLPLVAVTAYLWWQRAF